MPIPRMTDEEKMLESMDHFCYALSRIPENKRWIMEIYLNCFLWWLYVCSVIERIVKRVNP